MRISVIQPYLFPYVDYYRLISISDLVILYDDDFFKNKSFIYRNCVFQDNQKRVFRLHLSGRSQNKRLTEIDILDDTMEFRSFFLSSAAKVFRSELVEKSVSENMPNNLADYLCQCVENSSRALNVQTEIVRSSTIGLQLDRGATQNIIALCKHFGAKRYINLVGGKHIYSSDDFLCAGLELEFLNPRVGELSIVESDERYQSVIGIVHRHGILNTSSFINDNC